MCGQTHCGLCERAQLELDLGVEDWDQFVFGRSADRSIHHAFLEEMTSDASSVFRSASSKQTPVPPTVLGRGENVIEQVYNTK